MRKLIVLIMQLLSFCFLLFRDRVCGKDPLIQKCYLLKAKQCFFMFGDLAAFIPCLISMDLPASCRILWWKYSYLLCLIFPWHLFCITSRDHTAGLGPEGPDDSGLPRPGRARCRSAHMASNRLSDPGHVLGSRGRCLAASVWTLPPW